MVKAYLDTCVYIYYLEGDSKYGPQARDILTKSENKEIEITASTLIIQEIMTGLYKRNDVHIDEVWAMLFGLWNIKWIDFSIEIADEAAQIAAYLNLKTPDAIHLATALLSNCDKFFTNDKQFLSLVDKIPLKIELLK